jgi:hypothetical protein
MVALAVMREPYIPLFCSITDSTIWSADAETCKVFITLLAKADPEGYVAAAPDGIAATARLPVETVERALAVLMAPDPRSRNKENDGRRVVEVPRGYHVPAIPWFRKLAREEAERARKRQWARDHNSGRPESASATARRTETETETETEKKIQISKRRSALWRTVPSDWAPEPKHADKAQHWPAGRYALELEKFRNWEFKTPRSDASKAWFVWIASVSEKLPLPPSAQPKPRKVALIP